MLFRTARQLDENFFLQSFKIQQQIFLLLLSPLYRSANVPYHMFPRNSVNHVMNQ